MSTETHPSGTCACRRAERHQRHRRVRAQGHAEGPVLAVVRGEHLGARRSAMARSFSDFGVSFWQATSPASIGIVFSFLLVGLVSLAGKRGLRADDGDLARRVRRPRQQACRRSSPGCCSSAGRPCWSRSPRWRRRRCSSGSAGRRATRPRSSRSSWSPRSSSVPASSASTRSCSCRRYLTVVLARGDRRLHRAHRRRSRLGRGLRAPVRLGRGVHRRARLRDDRRSGSAGSTPAPTTRATCRRTSSSARRRLVDDVRRAASRPIVLVLYGLLLAGSATRAEAAIARRPDRCADHGAADLVPAARSRSSAIGRADRRRGPRHLLVRADAAHARRADPAMVRSAIDGVSW